MIVIWFLFAIWLAWPVTAAADEPAWLKKASRVTIRASIESPAPGAGGMLTLVLEVTPASGVHVYAPGNRTYVTPAVRLDAPEGVRLRGTAAFPPAKPFVFGDLEEVVQVYETTFRILQPLAMNAAARKRAASGIMLTGKLEYQACTAKVCFPPQAEPFEAALRAR